MVFHGLVDELERGATVVTASQRLAHGLRYAHAARRRAAGETSWPTPAVLPYSAWLDSLYEEALLRAGAAPLLLTEAQRRAHWTAVLAATDPKPVLLQPEATARAVAEAYALALRWRIDLSALDAEEHEDVRAFARWAAAYAQRLKAAGHLDKAELADWLIPRLAGVKLPARLVVAGFLDEEPQRAEFLAALRARGVDVHDATYPLSPGGGEGKGEGAPHSPLPLGGEGQGEGVSVRTADPDDELNLAARWARARHEADTTQRIGIVVHDLEARRARVIAAFDAVFEPARHAPGPNEGERPYGISLGIPLARAGRVGDALAALALGRSHAEWPVLSRLLLAPGIAGWRAERGGRARTELALRKRAGQKVALDWALNHTELAPDWTQRTKAARKALTEAPARRAPSAWGQAFADALKALGMPGDTPSDADKDADGALASLVGRLAEIDALMGRIGFEEFASFLTRQCNEELHQPRSAEMPVVVLDTLEAAGLAFDHLWIAGWSDASWPPAPRPNPFLPVRLQRAARLPQATAASQRTHCARVTAMLLGEAGEAVVSAPRMDGDLPLRPSPFAPAREATADELALAAHPDWAATLAATRALETLDDFQAPALPDAQAKGGTGTLKDFSACPFKAFATRRLHTEKLETPPAGPDAKTRGSLVHQVMEQVWLALKDHAGLVARSAAEREALVREAVDGALKHMRAQLPDLYPPPFVALERERLVARVLEWLAIEAKRAPFTVRGQESEEHIQVGPLTLHAFIDRVDELEDGSLAIIDYKTGKATKSKWAPPRPEEPQLPIYALHQSEPVGAVLYARVKAGEMGFDGYASDETLVVPAKQKEFKVSQPKEGFEETLAGWDAALTQLAEGYAQGHAAVAPKKRAVTCRYCHVSPLCRIGELGLATESEEEGGDE